jgi:ABC-2 type transport system permease protein
MKRLLKIEAEKLFSYRSFWLFIGLHGGLFFLLSVSLNSSFRSVRSNVAALSEVHVMHFPLIWQTLCYVGSWFHYLLGLLVILLVTNDYQCCTLRQHVVDGLSRLQYLGSQLLTICLLGLYASLATTALCVLFGFANAAGVNGGSFSQPAFSLHAGAFVFAFFVQGLGYMVFAMLVAIFCKRAVLSVGVFLTWTVAAEPIVALALDKLVSAEIAYLLPFHALSAIIIWPESLSAEQLSPLPAGPLGLGMLYVVAMVLLAAWRIRSQDL